MQAPEITTNRIELKINLTDEQFWQLCQDNRDRKFERTALGKLQIMPPTGGETGNSNIEIAYQLQGWSRQNHLGKAFDSSTGFELPNGANRSPDAAWVKMERWNALQPEQKEKFPPLCPDFVLELRSASDSLAELQQKMREYIANGAVLAWLLDRKNKKAEIYRRDPNGNILVEILENPTFLSGEDVLPGFTLDLSRVW